MTVQSFSNFGYAAVKTDGAEPILKAAPLKKPEDLLERVDFLRVEGFGKTTDAQRAKLGQFPTPVSVAGLMASYLMFENHATKLLDAGAGVGSLAAAAIAELGTRKGKDRTVEATAYEFDARLAERLTEAFRLCEEYADGRGIKFQGKVVAEDFIRSAVADLTGPLFGKREFNCAILNPPYKKLKSESEHRGLIRMVGIETSNLYTAFLALTVKLLEPDGEMVAIVPRSFCNGPYFKPFRELLLREMAIDAVHVFESRTAAFADDEVLQENIIFHAVKTKKKPKQVKITSSRGPDEEPTVQFVPPEGLVNPDDPEFFIHIVTDESEGHISELMGGLSSSLVDLGLTVSTGKVVDFRATEFLSHEVTPNTVPLIYPMHFDKGWITWPKPGSKKPNAIIADKGSANIRIPAAVHVLVKRFSAKEESRRVVAAVFDPKRVPCESVGFENHVNYFHEQGRGLAISLAKGLTAFLNSSLVDSYFRQFNGHTQVNATDLRNMKFPSRAKLEELGRQIGKTFPEQQALDQLVERELLDMAEDSAAGNAIAIKRRIQEALWVLTALGLPKAQLNERSALTLLALLNLKATTPWKQSEALLIGITPMMDYFAAHFGKKYAPNSRETVRRFTIHQFEQAGIVVKNPDKVRSTNSPDNVYQVEAGALKLFHTYGSGDWSKALATWLESNVTLRDKYAAERDMQRIPVKLEGGQQLMLSQEGQNILIKHLIEEFCPRYTPGGEVLYVGDTGDKYVVYDEAKLSSLGVVIDKHGKMPDLVVYFGAKQWLVLIEAVTSHGPVNAKRHHELKELFAGSTVGLVFVTAFLDRAAMKKYLHDIAWETEVWVAEAPSHLIHFNGERFLGPY